MNNEVTELRSNLEQTSWLRSIAMMIGGTCQISASCLFFFFFFVTNQEQRGDFEVLDSREVRLHFELGQHDGLIAPECSDMTDDYQGVDMALGKQTQGNLRVRGFAPGREMIPPRLLEARYLQHVGNDIAVGDLDSFLKKIKIRDRGQPIL